MLGYAGVVGWIIYAIIIPFIIFPLFISPSLKREQIKSNEHWAVSTLQWINTSAETYSSTYDHGYPPTLAALGPPKTANPNPSEREIRKAANAQAANLIDEELASSGIRGGYRFNYSAGPNETAWKVLGLKPKDVIDPKKLSIYAYTIHADPVTPGVTGERHYFTDQSRVVRSEFGEEATAESMPLSD